MGKGDKKTTKGKIIMGSHGKKRPRLKTKKNTPISAKESSKESKGE